MIKSSSNCNFWPALKQNSTMQWCSNFRNNIRHSENYSHFQVPWGVPGRAYLTIPPEIELTFSTIPGAGLGTFAKTFIPKYTWLGEYDGVTLHPEEAEWISLYTWMVSTLVTWCDWYLS